MLPAEEQLIRVRGNVTAFLFSWLDDLQLAFNGSQSIMLCSTHFSEYQDTSKKMRLLSLQVDARVAW